MLKKILAATSVAAFMMGSAHAVTVLDQAAVAAPIAPALPANLTSPVQVAQEALFDTTTKRTGVYGLRVSTAGIIPPGQNVFITFTVSGGTVVAGRTGAEVVRGVTGAVVTGQNANSVSYLMTTDNVATTATGPTIATPAAGQVDFIEFAIPVTATGCNTVTFSVTGFQTEAIGTPIENGAASLTGSAPVTCVNAIQATLTPDVASPFTSNDTALDVASPSPAFSDFVQTLEDNPGVVAPGVRDNARLGEYTLTITPARTRLDIVDVIANGDVTAFTTVATFTQAGAPAVESCIVNPNSGIFFDSAGIDNLVANTCTTGGAIAAAAPSSTGFFEVNLDTTGPVTAAVAQVVTATGTLVFTDPELIAGENFVSADVEDLVYNGQVFGPFDWVTDSSQASNTIFRVTGMSASPIPAQVIVRNSSTGLNGTYPITVPSVDIPLNGSEIRLNSSRLTAIAGNYGSADVIFVFSTGTDLDVDRLLASPAGAAISNFGDGANQDGNNGSPPPTTVPAATNDDTGSY